ncbi:septum formation inhibitor Maf [Sulfuriferula sp. AH1]|uniref:Maf family protein n=1 Tax=Sulfuriferula sp. AH1 TaxID=1985873 RepID=UPI000B3B9907|nr:Maf family protein [Sulfuriferula sp. AH1]ARU30650.1 septum formation inhibitor Maf [Sulfuriferula sp. AH1]
MNNFPPRIYLASRSPRRRELLAQMGVNYDVLLLRETSGRCDVDETPKENELPHDYVARIALAKAELGWQRACQRGILRHPVLGADTTVTLDNEILGKPGSVERAVAMLAKLSGRTHQVMTSVALAYQNRVHQLTSVSEVTFKHLSSHEIEQYAISGEPLDKAGGYAIQGRGAIFVRHLNGSYSGVMGLPIFETAELLNRYNSPTAQLTDTPS